jgi:aryl-alcohol dehydrogenase-like predicted oxidoreductase
VGNPDHDESIAIIHRALDAGINVIDTADVYARGESEEIVGKALQARRGSRDDVFLATKFHGSMHDEDPNQAGNSRRWIIREVEHSLRRLQVDHIDLYQVHRPRPEVDIDETLGALTDLVRQGKIRYLGTSTFLPSQVVEAQWVAEKRGRERPVSEQPPYSILAREVERDILPTAQKYGIGVLPWSPLAGGWLSGRYRRGEEPGVRSSRMERQPARHDPASPENKVKLEAVYALQELADEAGLSLIHLALASCSHTRRCRRPSSARARSSSSSRSSAWRRWSSRPTCSTGSTRSSLRAPRSTRQTGVTHRRRSSRRRSGAADPSPPGRCTGVRSGGVGATPAGEVRL